LIENLNQLDADIIFIKNIDNIIIHKRKRHCIKALTGILLELQQRYFFIYVQLIQMNLLAMVSEN
jgi:hypothetical protein